MGAKASLIIIVAAACCVFLLTGGLITPRVYAVDYTSTNFILRDPVISAGGGRSTSNSFEHISVIGQTVSSQNTSSNFIQRAGFLFFPIATTPVVTATAGDGQVSLTWTASSATLANITDYQVGTATVSGGPYTYVSVGNVLSSTQTGLTNGTAYYFRIRAFAGGLRLAESDEASATPTAPAPPPSGGGGGAPPAPAATSVILKGLAYPFSILTILQDGRVVKTDVADSQANFNVAITDVTEGIYSFGIWAEDTDGNRSITFSFTSPVPSGVVTTIGGIFIPPTISVDKTRVGRGDPLNFLGQTAPKSDVELHINSPETIVNTTTADETGLWSVVFDTRPLDEGTHTGKSKAMVPDGLLTSFSKIVTFIVGRVTPALRPCPAGDLNGDGRTNLTDFSIMLFQWHSTNDCADQNGDGIVNITDFSILLFWWTG